ncbi:hypothetical protein, conserved [Eimeria acervulina]|uniref:Uncharacterized protein n=1 Tax=Eimeria acervulina TaxID=5801 RepID=U6GKE3_EIMAC|nr:hypothetical protein, conserved [Eimeria acervulina]CDI80701.1 hypothetical protein, conserved [Eimeria acervulina]
MPEFVGMEAPGGVTVQEENQADEDIASKANAPRKDEERDAYSLHNSSISGKVESSKASKPSLQAGILILGLFLLLAGIALTRRSFKEIQTKPSLTPVQPTPTEQPSQVEEGEAKETGIATDDVSLQRYLDTLVHDAEILSVAWKKSSGDVRRGFIVNYTPNSNDREAEEEGIRNMNAPTVLLYAQEVEKMLNTGIPSPHDEEGRFAYGLHARLLSCICRAATEKLKMLQELERVHEEEGGPVCLLGLKENDDIGLPPVEFLERNPDPLASLEELSELLPGSVPPFSRPEIPLVLFRRMSSLVSVNRVKGEGLEDSLLQFGDFLKALNTSFAQLAYAGVGDTPSYSVPYSEEIIDTTTFVESLFDTGAFRLGAAAQHKAFLTRAAQGWTDLASFHQLVRNLEGKEKADADYTLGKKRKTRQRLLEVSQDPSLSNLYMLFIFLL